MLYFFNIAGAFDEPDLEGCDLADLSEARTEAVDLLVQTLREKPDLMWTIDEVRVEVTNDEKLLLFSIISFGVDAPFTTKRS